MALRLSEAIRLGAMLKPQAFDGNAAHGSCALRAAADAVGIADIALSVPLLNYAALNERWPILGMRVAFPVDADYRPALDVAIYSLNDSYEWTREAIADWVATIEAQQAEVVVPEPVAVLVTA